MKPYGDKRTAGYMRATGRSSCRCCNGSYAKVGNSSNRNNAIRGLKKSTRHQSKLQIKQDLQEDTINRYDYERATDEYGYEIIEQYNVGILYDFMHTLIAIAPELAWADTEDSLYGRSWNVEPRGLSAIPNKFKKWAPQTKEDWGALLERIIKERGSRA